MFRRLLGFLHASDDDIAVASHCLSAAFGPLPVGALVAQDSESDDEEFCFMYKQVLHPKIKSFSFCPFEPSFSRKSNTNDISYEKL